MTAIHSEVLKTTLESSFVSHLDFVLISAAFLLILISSHENHTTIENQIKNHTNK